MKSTLKIHITLPLKFGNLLLKTRFYLVLLFVTLWAETLPQSTQIRFDRITINDGLSLSSVYCIFQDSKGFMWFGTEDGLNKYDGNNFTIFRADPYDKNSISHKWTEIVFEDQSGILWLGSRGGLTRFDPASEVFEQFVYDGSNPAGLANDTVTAIAQGADNQLWVGTVEGLNRIDLITGSIERINPGEELSRGLSSRINFLLPDAMGNLWIACRGGCFFMIMK